MSRQDTRKTTGKIKFITRRRKDTLTSAKSTTPPFLMIRGVGQGDNKSCLAWDCFMDIAALALEKADVDNFYVRREDGSLAKAIEKIFADDLIAVSPNEKLLQRKADIVSALCLMFDITINVKKLRLFVLQFGDEMSASKDPTLTIRTNV